MWLNSTTQDALRAVVHMASLEPGVMVTVDEIARAVDLPRNYLSKTLNALRAAGVLHSTRGPRGGFTLAVDPAKLKLIDVIAPFANPYRRCLLGQAECSDRKACPAHRQWSEVAERAERFLNGTTVADLAAARASREGPTGETDLADRTIPTRSQQG